MWIDRRNMWKYVVFDHEIDRNMLREINRNMQPAVVKFMEIG